MHGPRLIEDPESEDWIIVAPRRGKRPEGTVASACPFCPFHLKRREMRAVPNAFPSLGQGEGEPYGHQEIIVEGNEHGTLADWSVRDTASLLAFHGKRIAEAKHDPRIRYIVLFKNQGREAGASQPHQHSQLFAMELESTRLIRERARREHLRSHTQACPACLAVRAQSRGPLVVHEDARAVAFVHPAGRFAYETRILTKRHADNLAETTAAERLSLAKALLACLSFLDERKIPYNFYTQELVGDRDQHCEIRLAPRLNLLAGLELSSGVYINPVDPKEAARHYRETRGLVASIW